MTRLFIPAAFRPGGRGRLFLPGLFWLTLAAPALAQPTLRVGTGTRLVGGGAVQLVYGGGTVTNNGSISLAGGQFTAGGPTTYGGSGTGSVFNVTFSHATGSSALNALLSVTNQATVAVNTALNANGQLALTAGANLVNNGLLTGTVQGLIAKATATSGNANYATTLSVNVGGAVMQYQWQSSANNSTWTNIAGATGATYTTNVTAAGFYRCLLTTTNTAYSQPTASVSLMAPLPVTLRYFNGRMTDAGALLAWATAREDNNAFFQIERSTARNTGAGLAFESIGTVPSRAEGGNSLTELTYAFTDPQPLPGVNYYRLMQTDRDGTRTQAGNIVALSRENQPSVLFPNPVSASGEAVIEPAIPHTGYTVSDVSGRIMQRQDAPGVLSRVSLAGLPAGVYVLTVQTDAGVKTFRLLR